MSMTGNSGVINYDNNITRCREYFKRVTEAAANWIAVNAESYARAEAPVYDGTPLAPHIGHMVTKAADGSFIIEIGSALALVAYGEVGTATLYEPPADFIENLVPEGHNHFGSRGISEWWYYDSDRGTFGRGYSHPASHFLQRAITDHAEQYARDMEAYLRSADF